MGYALVLALIITIAVGIAYAVGAPRRDRGQEGTIDRDPRVPPPEDLDSVAEAPPGSPPRRDDRPG